VLSLENRIQLVDGTKGKFELLGMDRQLEEQRRPACELLGKEHEGGFVSEQAGLCGRSL